MTKKDRKALNLAFVFFFLTTLSAGSDAPVRPFHTYGFGFLDELRFFVKDLDIPVYQTLMAATYNNALWMGILPRISRTSKNAWVSWSGDISWITRI